MGRKILFITADQMRHDALGANGGRIARTPVVDALAHGGIRYTRAHTQSVVCMPARSTMLTSQYPRTHGVWMNGVPLPADAPSVATVLHDAGYRTALIGKAHFEPHFDPELRFYENRMARVHEHGPHRGFDHMALATHAPVVMHYGRWMIEQHRDEIGGFCPNIDGTGQVYGGGGGDTGAVQVKHNPVPREHYHTDWVANQTIAFLDTLAPDADWFVWMSFPDPHHPWDPPQSEVRRVPWRDLDVPAGFPGSRERAETILRDKPSQWLDYYVNRRKSNFETPPSFVPAEMTTDQLREIDAMIHIENELIDEAVGRVMTRIEERGWTRDTDVFFTSDHGELQGDFGLLFKGPYHVDALMRVPFLWRPAPNAALAPAVVDAPVGHLDLAPTFCAIANVAIPEWMQGRALPADAADATRQKRERVLTEWDSESDEMSVHLRTIHRDGFTCTVVEKSRTFDGTEGELYDHREDPRQWRNLWNDPARRSLRDDLVADLRDSLPPESAVRRSVVASV